MPSEFKITNARSTEAQWLQNAMNKAGIGNHELHKAMEKAGFEGYLNNISMWRTGKTQIPVKWVPELCKLLFSENADVEAVEFLRKRLPEIEKYLNLANDEEEIIETSNQTKSKGVKPKVLNYIPKNGVHKGTEFIPFKNKLGKFQGGIDRFKKNIEEFDSISQLIERIQKDDKFKVRMAHPTDPSVAPSLIKRSSLIIT